MAVIKIIGQSSQGANYTFSQILSVSYQSDRFTPADILEFSALDNIGLSIFTRINLYLDNKLKFSGIVDVQKRYVGINGNYVKFVCRHVFGAMLDNEVKPYVYYNLSSEQLIKNHAMPYGIKGHRFPHMAIASEIIAYKGVSQWEFIELFCQLCYKKPPYVDSEGYITLESSNTTRHYFSNVKNGWINFSDAVFTYDTYNMISKLFLKTGSNDLGAKYNYLMTNSIANRFNIDRTRYHNPSKEWNNNFEQNAKYLLTNQNMDFLK